MSINTDPAALAQMARELERLDRSVADATRRVRSQLNSSRWNDPVRKEFENLLTAIERNQRGLNQMCTDGSKMLKTKEQQIRQYMGR